MIAHFFVAFRCVTGIMVAMNSKERMKAWQKLPPNTIAWETFKRLVGQFGTEEGIKKAKKLIDKQS